MESRSTPPTEGTSEKKIYVAGHSGLAGSAVMRALTRANFNNIVVASHKELDLTERSSTFAFLKAEQPHAVVVCAAKVGGILANDKFPVSFLHENLGIQTNLFDACFAAGVSRVIFLGSSCIYPRDCEQPIREESLLTGPLEATNRAYAIAKIAGIESCWSFNRQFGTSYAALMPTNLYGIGDNYHPEHSHVLPALLRRFHEAKLSASSKVEVWGSGAPRREFMFADDLGDAVRFLLEMSDPDFSVVCDPTRAPILNVGTGEDISIRELADTIARVTGYSGSIAFDKSKPDGTPRKLLDVRRMQALGWRASTPFESGLQTTYADFVSKHKDK